MVCFRVTDGTLERRRPRHVTKSSPDPQVVPSISNQTTPNSQPQNLSLPPLSASHTAPHDVTNLGPQYTPVIEQLSRDLANLERRGSRVGSDSSESVRSDTELLEDISAPVQSRRVDVTAPVHNSRDVSLPEQSRKGDITAPVHNSKADISVPEQSSRAGSHVNSTTPGSTPMAIWRKPDYSPSSYYSSYLDYNGQKQQPPKVVLKTFQINLDTPKSKAAAVDTSREHAKSSDVSKPCAQLSHLDETESTDNGLLYSTADISEFLKSQTSTLPHCASPRQGKDTRDVTSGKQTRDGTSGKQTVGDAIVQSRNSPGSSTKGSCNTSPNTSSEPSFRTPGGSKPYATPSTSRFRLPSLQSKSPSLSPEGTTVSSSTGNDSSTSGSSHVVDPHDLCNQIDQIFFSESEV